MLALCHKDVCQSINTPSPVLTCGGGRAETLVLLSQISFHLIYLSINTPSEYTCEGGRPDTPALSHMHFYLTYLFINRPSPVLTCKGDGADTPVLCHGDVFTHSTITARVAVAQPAVTTVSDVDTLNGISHQVDVC